MQSRLKITFPKKEVSICCRFSKHTMLEALREIQRDNEESLKIISESDLRPHGKPLISKNAKLTRCMEEICDGWFLNTEGGTGDKYYQILQIKKLLDLDLLVEVGDLKITTLSATKQKRKPKKTLKVTFEDGTEFCYESFKDVFVESMRKIGGAWLCAKDIMVSKFSRLVTLGDLKEKDRVEFEEGYWLKIPQGVQGAFELLQAINRALKQSNLSQFKIEIINLKNHNEDCSKGLD